MDNNYSDLKFGKLSQEILNAIGGKENINNAFHCITRLRIVVIDKSKVDMESLKKVEGVLKVIESGGQIQCVIGTGVSDVFSDFAIVADLKNPYNNYNAKETVTKENLKETKKTNIFVTILNTLASCVSPGLYAIVAGGMIKGIVSLITAFGLLEAGSDFIVVLNGLGDAPFYFMPFIVGFNASKRFQIREVFGIMIAGILMYPLYMSPAEGISGYNMILFDIPAYNYKASIFPVILSVWIFSLVFKQIDKRMPSNLKIVFSGALSFIISAPIFLGFAAPLGNWIAKTLTGTFGWLFTTVGPLAGALFGGAIPLFIIFGIKGWSAIELNNIETLGHDYMLPHFFYSNLAVSGAVIGSALKKKKGTEKSASISTGLVCILGITEPALYGIALQEKKPLYASMIGGACAGALAMFIGVVTYAFSMPGITSIATYIGPGNNFLKLLIVMAVAWVTSFVISYTLTEKEK